MNARLGRSLRCARVGLLGLALSTLAGCAIANFIGGAAQNFEYQKLRQMPAKYPDLEGKRVAVVVDVDRTLLYEYPKLVDAVTGGVTLRIGRDVPGIKVMRPDHVTAWQWQTPQWNALAYGEIAERLDVDRVVHIDILEYRLNPPGNRWLWEGVILANIGIVEREFPDIDLFAEQFVVQSEFPDITGVDRASASAEQIEFALLSDFIKKTAWLFHEHLEPKYPDKYRPEMDQ